MACRSNSDPELCKAYGARWNEARRIRASILRHYSRPDGRAVDLNNDAVLKLLEFEPFSYSDDLDLFGGLTELPSVTDPKEQTE